MHPDLTAYIAHLKATRKSSSTVERYSDVLVDFDQQLDGVAPGELARAALQRFATAPRRDGLARAPAGANLRVAVMRGLYSFLTADGRSAASPAAGLVGVPEPRCTPKYLTDNETRRLLDHVSARSPVLRSRNVALVVTFWQTALRVSEVARLRVGQLDREARVLRDVQIKGGHIVDVLVNTETLEVLDRYLAGRGELAADAPVFARRDGGKLSVRAIQSLFETWRHELGWTRRLHPHVLRHTSATHALAQGVDIATVADLLNHQGGLRTVMRYAAVQDGKRREALRTLGQLVPRDLLEDVRSTSAQAWTHTVPQNETEDAEGACAEGPFHALDEAS